MDDFHVDVSRLYPCDINDKSAASMKLSRAASSAEAASNAGDVEVTTISSCLDLKHGLLPYHCVIDVIA